MAKTTFARKFRLNLERMAKTLEAYLEDPAKEENMHEVRSAVRRLDATFPLLPKKARSRYHRRIEKCREFLRVSSRTRDCDVIIGRVTTLGALDTSDLQKEKKVELAEAVRLARSLQKLPPMRLPQEDDQRIHKVARRLIGRIGKELPAVLSDSKVEELHRLRKDFRKLRYMFETMSAQDRKKYMKKAWGRGRDLELKELQALLGLIHDSDVTIEYLHGKPGAGLIMKKEIRTRKQLYRTFVEHMK